MDATDLAGSRADQLRQQLEARSKADPDYWSFQHAGKRSGSHALFQYPAMMVPELQGALLDDIRSVYPGVRKVFDPFTGSGTVMLESAYRGLSFYGVDINPMAVLLSTVKAFPPRTEEARAALQALQKIIKEEPFPVRHDFEGINKWFHHETIEGLTALRAGIRAISDLRSRRFLWVCLAETVRLVSNSRISTFKLHTYATGILETRRPSPLATFVSVTNANINRLDGHWARAAEHNESATAPRISIRQGSVLDLEPGIAAADILMTSPPYGDNKTTVPYGQHSYLPLRWIDGHDIPGGLDPELLQSTSKIDSLSLGGSLRQADKQRERLATQSPAFESFLKRIEDRATLRRKALSFTSDYRRALASASTQLRAGGLSLFTLGERRIGGETMPLTSVTLELLQDLGHEHITTIERRLPLSRKRMAGRNSEGATMTTESILVTRKASS